MELTEPGLKEMDYCCGPGDQEEQQQETKEGILHHVGVQVTRPGEIGDDVQLYIANVERGKTAADGVC